jgi:hypothetical protein
MMRIYANKIYSDAIRYAQQIPVDASNEPSQSSALVSIMFAALSVETFINELAVHAENECEVFSPHGVQNPAVQTFANILKDMVTKQVSTSNKLHMGSFLLGGKAFDKGSTTFQNFTSLVKLRNAIVHLKPFDDIRTDDQDNITFLEHEIETLFNNKGVLGKHVIDGQEFHVYWLDRVATRAMAKWACAAASGMVNAMLDAALNTGHFGKLMDSLYRLRFNVKP